jgi:hypothetical protein
MIETLTVITISVLLLIFFRPGKTPPLESRLTINRPGRYQLVLAPKLNLAQPFIEAIVERIGTLEDPTLSGEMQCLAVRDKHVTAHQKDVYLLAISCRSGILYIQATPPVSDDAANYLETIRKFAGEVLASVPVSGTFSQKIDARIVDAVNEVAQKRGIDISLLPA